MKPFPSLLVFNLLFAFCGMTMYAVAQDCANVEFAVFNTTGGEIAQLNVAYEISFLNSEIAETGLWEVTEAGVFAPMCLPVGCYFIAIEGASVNPNAVEVQLMQSDYIMILSGWIQDGNEGTWITEFCVETPIEFYCPEAIDYAAGEGCEWSFEIGSFQQGESVDWNFGDGSGVVAGGHFMQHVFSNAGTYEVTAFFTSFDCPMGVYLTTTIVVEGCGEEECVLEMDVSSADGMWYLFEIPEQPEGAIIEWYIDGQVVPPTSENGLTFEAGFDFNPYWSVCVEVFTDACPGGMEACYTNLESSDCPDPEMMEVEYLGGCYALFWLYDENIWEIGWSVNGVLIEWGTTMFFDYSFPSDGDYVVTAELYSATCQGELYEWEIEIEGCGEEACLLDVEWGEIECNEFLIGALNQPEDATIFWTLDGEPYDYGVAALTYTFEEDGCHIFTAGYETPECPAGVFAEVEICSDCTGTSDLFGTAASAASFEVWPNPTNSALFWKETDFAGGTTLLIHTLDGRMVMNQEVFSASGSMNVAQLPEGWYVVTWAVKSREPVHTKLRILR